MVSQDWMTLPLGKVVTLQRGYDLPSQLRRPGEVLIVTSSGIGGTHNKAMVSGPGVVTGRYGTIGEVFYVASDFWPLNTTLFVRDFHGNDPLFVSYLLRTIDFQTHSGKSGVPGVNRNDLHEEVVLLPPKAEQEAIAEALSDADALIESLEQLIAKKRQIKQGAMQELLTGKKRLPGFDGEWEVKRLGDVCRITTGKKDVNEGNPDGQFPFFTCSRTHTYSDSYSFDMEAIMIAGNGDVGNLHYYKGKFEAYQRTYVLFDFATNVNYLWQQLNTYLADSLGLRKIGTSIPYIKKENLVNSWFNSPRNEAEQTAIAAILSDMDTEIAALEDRLAKARQIKQGMMQELLTGRVRLV